MISSGQAVHEVFGSNRFSSTGCSDGKGDDEADPTLLPLLLESQDASLDQKSDGPIVPYPIHPILEGQGQFTQGSVVSPRVSGDRDRNGRLRHGLGRSLRAHQSPGLVVEPSTSVSHKLQGVVGGSSNSEVVTGSCTESVCVGENRQHSHQTIHSKSGWYRFPGSLRTYSTASRVVPGARYQVDRRVHSRSSEYSSGSFVQENVGSDGVVPEAIHSQSVISPLQGTTNRSLRISAECQTSSVLQLAPRSQCSHSGRLVNVLESRDSLCLSTDCAPSQGTAQGPAGSSSIHDSNRSSLARSTLVSSTVRFIDRASSPAPFNARPSDSGTGQGQACEPGTLVPGSMACKRRALVAQGLSEQVARTILAARAVSTYKSYESGWKHYSKWCKRRSVNPFTSSVEVILRYLQFCLRTLGLSHSSIRNRVYAIALYHVSFPLDKLSRHPWVKDFVRGAKRLCPTLKDSHPVWDLQFVLESLQQAPFEPLSSRSLAWLTWKTAFLVAVTTAKRVGELKALSASDRYLQITPRGVRMQLNPVFIPKVNSVANRDADIFLEPFCTRASCPPGCTLYCICPCRAILKYVLVTKAFRKTDQFFVCYGDGPTKGQAASKATISRWVRRCISEAYLTRNRNPPKGLKAHQCRGIAATWAQFNNTSLNDILRSATWASSCTFATFYQLNLASNPSTASFGTNVLRTALDRRP